MYDYKSSYATIQCPKCNFKTDLFMLVPKIICPNCGEVIKINYPEDIFPKRKYNEDGCLEKKEDVDDISVESVEECNSDD